MSFRSSLCFVQKLHSEIFVQLLFEGQLGSYAGLVVRFANHGIACCLFEEYLIVFNHLIAFHDPDLYVHLHDIGFHPDVSAVDSQSGPV